MKRFCAYLLLAGLLGLLLAGCAGLDPDILTVDHVPYQRSQYAAAYQYSRARLREDMEQRGLPEADVLADPALSGEYTALLQEMAQEQLVLQTVVEKACRDSGVRIRTRDRELLAEAQESLGGEETFRAYLRETGLSEGTYLDILRLQLQVRELAAARAREEMSDDGFRDWLEAQISGAVVEIVGDIHEITPENAASFLK